MTADIEYLDFPLCDHNSAHGSAVNQLAVQKGSAQHVLYLCVPCTPEVGVTVPSGVTITITPIGDNDG